MHWGIGWNPRPRKEITLGEQLQLGGPEADLQPLALQPQQQSIVQAQASQCTRAHCLTSALLLPQVPNHQTADLAPHILLGLSTEASYSTAFVLINSCCDAFAVVTQVRRNCCANRLTSSCTHCHNGDQQ